MAATIKDAEEEISRRKHIKAVLVNKLEGCSDTVNMAVTIPHEDAVISVSDDKWVENLSRVTRCLEVSHHVVLVEFLMI